MSSETQVISEVDLNANGCHSGFLRVPHSVTRSAYGWIPVPLVSIRNGSGPVVLLIAGNHGDEYEGQVLLSQLSRELNPASISGHLIMLPMANYPAAEAGLRNSPIDHGNLNRSFPGDAQGSPTEMIAHYIESELLATADYLLDIHSGGSSLRYLPTILVAKYDDPGDHSRAMTLVRALGFPRAVLYPESVKSSYSSAAARRQGVIGLTLEMAGGGNVDRDAMKLLREAIPRYLNATGLVSGNNDSSPPAGVTEPPMNEQMEFLEVASPGCAMHARQRGVFEAAAVPGEFVKKGQLAGWIHHPDTPWMTAEEIHFEIDARVVCVRVPARVITGDCLYELGIPVQPQE